jgi:hypothetical protein
MRFTTFLNATAAVLLAGCNPLTQACTLIGCESGLLVQLTTPPSGAYRVEAIVAGAAPVVLECGATPACPPIVFRELEAERVTIRVTTGDRTVSRDFTPQYENQYPNGRRCGPACRSATVNFQL